MPRKVFVAGEILTASDVNTQLMDQSVMVFDDATARATAIPTPVEGMVTYLKDTDAVEKFDGDDFVNVNTDSGKILQVVQTAKTDTDFSSSSGDFTPITNLTASITPASTSSKIMIVATVTAGASQARAISRFRLTRNSSPVGVGDAVGSRKQATGSSNPTSTAADLTASHGASTNTFQFLDLPASVATLTYGVDVAVPDGIMRLNRNNNFADNTNPENATHISTITLMEVAG